MKCLIVLARQPYTRGGEIVSGENLIVTGSMMLIIQNLRIKQAKKIGAKYGFVEKLK